MAHTQPMRETGNEQRNAKKRREEKRRKYAGGLAKSSRREPTCDVVKFLIDGSSSRPLFWIKFSIYANVYIYCILVSTPQYLPNNKLFPSLLHALSLLCKPVAHTLVQRSPPLHATTCILDYLGLTPTIG